jgi:hypothetical protein
MTTQLQPTLGQSFLAQARHRLADCLEKLRHCLSQLDDTQVWWRPSPGLNSIANLLLHLGGNLRQWIVAGVGGAPDIRERPLEFSEQGPIPKEELLRRLETVVLQADEVLARLPEAQLLEPRRIQGFEETLLSAIFGSVAHFHGHTQEIVLLTRLQRGDAYHFAWTPMSAEQGAPLDKPTRSVAKAIDAVFKSGPPPMPEQPSPAGKSTSGAGQSSPLGDYVRELGQEFQEEQDEGKL